MYEDLIFRRIFDRLRRLNREKLSRSIGLVTDDSPLTVEIGGEEIVGIEKINYSPTIGDRVWVSRSHGDMVVHGEIGSSGGGGGSYSPPIPQSDVTSLVSDLAGKQPLDSDLTAIAALSTTAFGRALLELADAAALRTAGALAGTGVSNTFTLPQTIDLGATGTGLTVDVHTGGGEKWLKMTEGGTERGSLAEFANLLVLKGESGLILSTTSSDLTLSPSGNISADSNKITSLADATTGTDALNRQTGDARYQPLDADLTAIAGLTSAADKVPYFTGSGSAATATVTSVARDLLDDTTVAAQRATLGLSLGTNHAVPSLSVLSTLAVTADRVYYAQLVIPTDCTLTGLRVYSSSATGTCNSALYNSSGTRVANSTAATTVGSNVFNVPFDSTYGAVPGVYFVGIVFSGTPTMGLHYPGTNSGFVAGPGSGATATSITPPTTVSGTRVVAMSTY